MNGKYLLLGTNLGNKLENLSTALKLISEKAGIILARSSIYRTSSWGMTGQPDYLNQVVQVETNLSPHDLMHELLSIETGMGRIRNKKWDNRLIDIDILFYDDRIIDESGLQLPHPQIPDRRFTLAPLAELAGDQVHPVNRLSIKELLGRTSDKSRVEKLSVV